MATPNRYSRLRHIRALWRHQVWTRWISAAWAALGVLVFIRDEFLQPKDEQWWKIMNMIPNFSVALWVCGFAVIFAAGIFEASFRLSAEHQAQITSLQDELFALEQRLRPAIFIFLDPACNGVRVVRTRAGSQPGPDSKWVQVMVQSVNDAPLIECEVHLIRVDRLNDGGAPRNILTEPTFCTWSRMEGEQQKRITIPAKISYAANIFSIEQNNPHLYTHTTHVHYGFDDEIQRPGKYKLTIGAYARDCPTEIISLLFQWGGSYDSVSLALE